MKQLKYSNHQWIGARMMYFGRPTLNFASQGLPSQTSMGINQWISVHWRGLLSGLLTKHMFKRPITSRQGNRMWYKLFGGFRTHYCTTTFILSGNRDGAQKSHLHALIVH